MLPIDEFTGEYVIELKDLSLNDESRWEVLAVLGIETFFFDAECGQHFLPGLVVKSLSSTLNRPSSEYRLGATLKFWGFGGYVQHIGFSASITR